MELLERAEGWRSIASRILWEDADFFLESGWAPRPSQASSVEAPEGLSSVLEGAYERLPWPLPTGGWSQMPSGGHIPPQTEDCCSEVGQDRTDLAAGDLVLICALSSSSCLASDQHLVASRGQVRAA